MISCENRRVYNSCYILFGIPELDDVLPDVRKKFLEANQERKRLTIDELLQVSSGEGVKFQFKLHFVTSSIIWIWF